MYGIQTTEEYTKERIEFENDVNMYGIQTIGALPINGEGLRMM